MRSGIVISCVVAGAFLFSPTSAHADGDVARQHFDLAKKLRDEGDCSRAIVELEKSLAADKSIGAFYNLGYCQEQLGHRQEAYGAYKQAQHLASSKHDERVREIGGALGSLLDTPHIRLILPQPLPAGIQITVDDQPLPENVYAAETVVFTKDTTSHVVNVSAPGYERRQESIETKDLKVIDLRRTDAMTPSPSAVESPPRPRAWTSQHWLGLGLATGGVVGGAVVSLLALGHLSNVDDIQATYVKTRDACPKSPAGAAESVCETNARGRHNDATASENTRIMVAGGLVGAVALGLLVSGGIVFFNAPRSAKSCETAKLRLHLVPEVGSTNGGLFVVGTF